MSSPVYSDSKLENYLRGELPQDEIDVLENELLRNDELFERLQTVEVILVDSYLENEMTGEDKQRFELSFLNNPANRWKLEKERVFRESLLSLRKRRSPIFQLAAAAVVLISLAILGWLAIRSINQKSRDLSTEVVPQPSPYFTVTPTPAASPSPTASATEQKPANPVKEEWLYLKDSRTGVMGTGDEKQIVIAADTKTLRLRFELPADAGTKDSFGVSIKDEFDYPIFPSQGIMDLKPIETRYRGRSIRALSLDVPVTALKLDTRYRFEIPSSTLRSL